MNKLILFFVVIFSISKSDDLNLKYEKYILPNGLQVILHQDNSVPLVAVNIWYHVGSAREKVGRTGFAHLFEHMLFQGSQNVGDDEHFRLVEDAGGDINGSTSNDRTNYYEVVPSQFLEMALWLEADRMGFLLPSMTQAKLDNQRDVVKNERRQRVDNQPYGRVMEKVSDLLYEKEHTYNWPVIGSMADLSSASMDDIKEFFKLYYAPNNASMVISGDFNLKQTKEWISKYFSTIKKGVSVSDVVTNQATLNSPKRDMMEDRVNLPMLALAWHTTPLLGKDDPALTILSNILAGGKNSRLYKTLVYDKQIAQSVSGFEYGREISGIFMMNITAKPGVTLTEIEKIVNDEISKLQSEKPTERELNRSKNSLKSGFIYSLQSVLSKADQLNEYNTFWSNPGAYKDDLARLEKVTTSDVQEAAKKYLGANRVTFSVVPIGKKELAAQ